MSRCYATCNAVTRHIREALHSIRKRDNRQAGAALGEALRVLEWMGLPDPYRPKER